jgi:asparagine synthase (glutamine-hydrolysing)
MLQAWMDGPVGLGHALFRSTTEASYENQPASLDNEVWITGCIRIDAREDLVRELGLQRDIRLAQTPDSHLVLRAYEAWGERCPEHLLGDFSFAIWDRRKKRLFCARDRFGMRQLAYARAGDTYIVSNSIDCIRHHPLVSDRLCDQAIADFLLFGDHRWGYRAQTSFADIQTLEPAHCLSLNTKGEYIRRYWDLEEDIPPLRYRKEADYIEHFRDLFDVCVSDRIRSRNVFVSLSGGMDSPSIAATVREQSDRSNRSINLHAATIAYDSIHPGDERKYVDAVSKALKLSTHYIDGGNYPLLSPPVLTTSPLELYQPRLWLDLEQYASTKSRVVLNGDGGDEVLAFTSVMNALKDINPLRAFVCIFQLKRCYGRYPPLGTGLGEMVKKRASRHGGSVTPYPYPQWLTPELEEKLDLQHRWSACWSANPRATPRRNPMIRQSVLAPDWNTDDKYMNSGFTLPEKRSPFLDPRLIKFMISLPALPWLFKKHLLRRSMLGKLPDTVLRRPKTPLGLIHDSLIKNAAYGKLNDWKSAQGFDHFVDRSKLPVFDSASVADTNSYVNLRPLLLNQWLTDLGDSSTIKPKAPIVTILECPF